MNKYKFATKEVQQKPFPKNVISMQDYKHLKSKLKQKEDKTDYFLIWGIACTGASISELLNVKVEHIIDGQMDINGKGQKSKRIFFIREFQKEAIEWLSTIGRLSGYVFINSAGNVMSTEEVEEHIKSMAKEYGIDASVMHPDSFRHMFAKTLFDNKINRQNC